MLFYHFWFILWTGKIAFFGLWFFTISICFSDCVWLCFCFWNLLSPFRILLQKCLIWRVLFLSVFTKNHCYYTRRMSSPTLCVVSKPVKLCNAPHGGTDTHTRISKHSGSIPETLKFTATSIFEMRGWRFYMPNHSSGPHALHCQKKAEQLTHRCSRYKRPNHFHLLTYCLTVSILADRIHSKSARLKPRLPKDCLQRSFTSSPLCGAFVGRRTVEHFGDAAPSAQPNKIHCATLKGLARGKGPYLPLWHLGLWGKGLDWAASCWPCVPKPKTCRIRSESASRGLINIICRHLASWPTPRARRPEALRLSFKKKWAKRQPPGLEKYWRPTAGGVVASPPRVEAIKNHKMNQKNHKNIIKT